MTYDKSVAKPSLLLISKSVTSGNNNFLDPPPELLVDRTSFTNSTVAAATAAVQSVSQHVVSSLVSFHSVGVRRRPSEATTTNTKTLRRTLNSDHSSPTRRPLVVQSSPPPQPPPRSTCDPTIYRRHVGIELFPRRVGHGRGYGAVRDVRSAAETAGPPEAVVARAVRHEIALGRGPVHVDHGAETSERYLLCRGRFPIEPTPHVL